MATTYLGVDLNNDNADWSVLSTKVDFVIMQAYAVTFSGTGFAIDSSLSYNLTQARSYNKPHGFYFFVQTTTYNNSSRWGISDVATIAQKDADYFTSHLGSLLNGEMIILDFDLAGGVGYSPDMDTYAYNFCKEVIANYGGSSRLPYCIIYSSLSLLNKPLGWVSTAGITYAWAAFYGVSDPPGASPNDWSQSASPWHGLNYPKTFSTFSDYALHQYSSKGTGSNYGSTKTYIDLDSFYSFNNTISDWNLFGFQGGVTGTGTLNYATITQPTITFTQPQQQTISVPQNSYDRVLFSKTFTGSVNSSTWPQAIAGPATNVNQSCYPVGNFSYNSGATWQDYGFLYSDDFGLNIGNLPVWVIQPVISSTGQITLEVTYPNQNVNGDTGNHSANFTFHIALLASYSPSATTGTPQVTQSIAYANLVPNQTNYAIYRRISKDAAKTSNGTVAHGLGVVPNMAFWQYDNSNDVNVVPSVWTSAGGSLTNMGVAMDATNIYFQLDSKTQAILYRTYKDD